MKLLTSIIFFFAILFHANAQKLYVTKTGQIKLITNSSQSENFKAVNNEVESRWLESSGQIVFSALINGFKFESDVMEDHFNDIYTDKLKFPKFELKGFINDIQHIDLTNAGGNEITIDGTLNVHGISKKIILLGSLTILSSGKIMLAAQSKLKLKDFNLTYKEIASEITFSIYCIYE